MPAMNVERTMDTNAVVTLNCAIASRSQMSSYRMLQSPETKKNRKYHIIRITLYYASEQHGELAFDRGVGPPLIRKNETFSSSQRGARMAINQRERRTPQSIVQFHQDAAAFSAMLLSELEKRCRKLAKDCSWLR